MTSIDSMLAERGSRYGAFKTHAEHTQAIKRLLIKLMGRAKWDVLADDQREALEMIAHKLGRITNGDPNYDDSWRDIAGYADLVAKRLADPTPEAKAEAKPETGTAPLKIGDKVHIVSTIDVDLYEGDPGFVDAMVPHLGRTGTVVKINSTGTPAYVKVDDETWWWRTQDLTPVATESQAKTDETGECGCPACRIRRLLQTDEVVIAVESEEKGESAKDDERSLLDFIQTLERIFKKS